MAQLMKNRLQGGWIRRLFIILIVTGAACSVEPAAPTDTDLINSTEEVKTMQVVIQVTADVARPLHQLGPPTEQSEALLRMAETFGLTLKPIHPGTDDPELQTYFMVDVHDPETAQELTDRLQQMPGIEAAYIKPPDELP